MLLKNKEIKVFVAGATGAVGSVLCRLLVGNYYKVFGMTRKQEKAEKLLQMKVNQVILNVYDKEALEAEIVKIQPNVIIHQLTDLPFGLPKEKMDDGLINNAKIRDIGTRNLISAARKTNVERFIT